MSFETNCVNMYAYMCKGFLSMFIMRFIRLLPFRHYNLTILATDKGSPVMSTAAVIYVTVTVSSGCLRLM